MSRIQDPLHRAAALRDEFDRAFAEPHREVAGTPDRFLAVRVSGRPFAVRLEEMEGIASNRSLTSIPEGPPGLAGLAGIRGRLIAVYDLADLLGLDAECGAARWLLQPGEDPSLAFRVEAFEGCREVDTGQVSTGARGKGPGRFICGTFVDSGESRSILSISRIVQGIEEQAITRRKL